VRWYLLRVAKLLVIVRIKELHKILGFIKSDTLNLVIPKEFNDLFSDNEVVTVPVDPLEGSVGFEIFERC